MLIFAGVTGMLLGGIFFGGLWWTVQRGMTSKRPGLLFLSSIVIRMGITLGGFYLISNGQWKRLVACLVGFLIMRMIVERTSFSREVNTIVTLDTSHAPES